MESEKEKIKNLFEASLPPMTPDSIFIQRIVHSISAVELIALENKRLRRQNRISALTAAAVGFVCGVVLTLFYPLILEAISSVALSFMKSSSFINEISSTIACVVISLGSIGGAFSAYSGINLWFRQWRISRSSRAAFLSKPPV